MLERINLFTYVKEQLSGDRQGVPGVSILLVTERLAYS